MLNDKIRSYIEKIHQQGLLRTREITSESAQGAIFFDSNDYLSLTGDKRIKMAYEQAYRLFPSGSGASMMLSGYHSIHHELENAFAQLLQVDDCILFSSGYAANIAITALLGNLDIDCLIDKNMHASVYDGLSLAKAHYSRFIHNSMEDLVAKLSKIRLNSVIMTEGIFSMSGQKAPLSTIACLGKAKGMDLIVDEAHSFGILGPQGAGAVAEHQLSQKEVPLRVIPFGKAMAAQGAIVAGQKDWIQALLQAGRSIIYSTAISPALSYGLLKSLDIVVMAEDRRLKLAHLIDLFKQYIRSSCLDWKESDSPIQQLKLGCPYKALDYAAQLRQAGIYCSAIRAPTVNVTSTGLRIILNYSHKPEHISTLFNTLHEIYEYQYH